MSASVSSPDRIDVVYLGYGMREVGEPAPEALLRRRLELGDAPVLLTVAAALPHKNLDRLLAAIARLDIGDRPPPTLVMVGHAGRRTEELRALATALGIADRVRITGWVDDAELEGLYRMAHAFVYPSLHEGFGMPVLEAMRRGVPTACADRTSLPEVAGDAALLFDPTSVDAIAATIARLFVDPGLAERLSEAASARAERFSWEATADGMWATYGRVASGARQ